MCSTFVFQSWSLWHDTDTDVTRLYAWWVSVVWIVTGTGLYFSSLSTLEGFFLVFSSCRVLVNIVWQQTKKTFSLKKNNLIWCNCFYFAWCCGPLRIRVLKNQPAGHKWSVKDQHLWSVCVCVCNSIMSYNWYQPVFQSIDEKLNHSNLPQI